jgi:hypothetical protein
MHPDQVATPTLRLANELTKAIGPYKPGQQRSWTIVTVSKVLHRLSPNVPIIDSRVLTFYGTTWAGIVRRRMFDDLVANRIWMEPIALDYPVRGNPLPLTRMADILIWMDGRDSHGRSV